MRAADFLLLLSQKAAADTALGLYMTSLTPLVWYRLREASGTSAKNSGSLAAMDATALSCTVGQAGVGSQGANEAYLYDGANSKLTLPTSAALAALTTFSYAFLVKAGSAGEASAGTFFNWSDASGNYFHFNGNINQCDLLLKAATTAPRALTAQLLTANTPAWIFVTYDDAGDRKPYVYKGIAGAVTNKSGAQTAAVGTLTAPTNPMVIGNKASQDKTWDGLFDEIAFFNYVLSVPQMTALTQKAGV